MNVGDQIKNYRKERGITQQKLSEISCINLSTIKKYESNNRNPKLLSLEKIANALDVRVSDILGREL